VKLRVATCTTLPEPDVDEAPLAGALARAGFDAQLVAWDDPRADWDAPVPTIIRSTWNYPLVVDTFLAWVERAARAAPRRCGIRPTSCTATCTSATGSSSRAAASP
jgi:hypothetical protein